MDTYRTLQDIDKKHLWHPYTQMKDYAERDLLLVDRAEGIMLYDLKGKEYFDRSCRAARQARSGAACRPQPCTGHPAGRKAC